MIKGFWEQLKRPIMVLAPMANVTDAAFRRIIAKYGKPDVTWTEFVSADGLMLAHEKGRASLMRDLVYSEAERPIVAQFFTSVPEMMEKAARLAVELGFDGVDINMGCPDKSVEKQKAGAALMKNPALAQEIIAAARCGAESSARKIPVSVKTRIGYNKNQLETWIPALLEARPAAITLHARTRKEMSLVPARWEHVREAVALRDDVKSETLILGNGDALDLADARAKVEETGADGVMLGRAIFGNPWLFSEKIPTPRERMEVLVEHTKLFEELLGDVKNFAIMKKHYKAYISGWDGAKELRMRLMETESAQDVEKIVHDHLAGA